MTTANPKTSVIERKRDASRDLVMVLLEGRIWKPNTRISGEYGKESEVSASMYIWLGLHGRRTLSARSFMLGT